MQARCQGDASGVMRASSTTLEAPAANLQNIENKPADQPAKKRATPYRIHVLCLLNRRGWKQLIYKNICIHPVQVILYSVMERIV